MNLNFVSRVVCFGLLLGGLVSNLSQAQEVEQKTAAEQATEVLNESETVEMKDFTDETEAEKAERMKWFNDSRFGLFIHWGLYAQPAGVWKGKDYKRVGEWIPVSYTHLTLPTKRIV